MIIILAILALAALICVISTATGARVPLWISVALLAVIEVLEKLLPLAAR